MRSGSETVEPVGKVHGVDASRDRENTEHQPKPVRDDKVEGPGDEDRIVPTQSRRRSCAGKPPRPTPSQGTSCAPASRASVRRGWSADRRSAPIAAHSTTSNTRSINGAKRTTTSAASRTTTKTSPPIVGVPVFRLMGLRRVFVGLLPYLADGSTERAAPLPRPPRSRSRRAPRSAGSRTRRFIASSSSSGFSPRPRHFNTTTGVCSSLLPCGLSSKAASTLAAQTPRERPRTFALPRSLASTTAHAMPVRSRSGSREAVGIARCEDDRPLVGRHRSGISVECRDRIAHHSVKAAAPAGQPRDELHDGCVNALSRSRRDRSRAEPIRAD